MRKFSIRVAFVVASASTAPLAQQSFDVLIRGGRVIDGTGAAARVADIGITNGRIAAIGSLAAATARTTIDARGLVVAPGFIDVHTHADEIAGHPRAEHFVRMGVTTVIGRILKHPQVSIASDSGLNVMGEGVPHPRGYGNNPRALARYVRERKVIGLEEAIRKMTSLPADHFGFADRGRLSVGKAADVVVFDPARVVDRATYEQPHQYPAGIAHVLVNGVVVVQGAEHTGATPGQVLRHRRPV